MLTEFQPGYCPGKKVSEDDLIFLYSGRQILMNKDGLPTAADAAPLFGGMDNFPGSIIHTGKLGGQECFALDIGSLNVRDFMKGRPGFLFEELRTLLLERNDGLAGAAGLGAHLCYWDRRSRYCGVCGALTERHEKERAKYCSACGTTEYPRISPAIIIAVECEGRLLLAHNRNFPEGRYSLLAGFMEPGETPEQTAVREVREEVGIEIADISYISAQPWPFPDSLMIGLTARWASGQICPDGEEIEDAGWFSPDEFPEIPGNGTIARKIIDRYIQKHKTGEPAGIQGKEKDT